MWARWRSCGGATRAIAVAVEGIDVAMGGRPDELRHAAAGGASYAATEGVRREGPSIVRVWQRWQRRLSKAATISLRPRKPYQSS